VCPGETTSVILLVAFGRLGHMAKTHWSSPERIRRSTASLSKGRTPHVLMIVVYVSSVDAARPRLRRHTNSSNTSSSARWRWSAVILGVLTQDDNRCAARHHYLFKALTSIVCTSIHLCSNGFPRSRSNTCSSLLPFRVTFDSSVTFALAWSAPHTHGGRILPWRMSVSKPQGLSALKDGCGGPGHAGCRWPTWPHLAQRFPTKIGPSTPSGFFRAPSPPLGSLRGQREHAVGAQDHEHAGKLRQDLAHVDP
jgi:hypothetical protein